MKKCSMCGKEKPLSEFPSSGYYKRVDGTKTKSYKPECKPCLVKKQTDRYNELWNKYFLAECSRCGYNNSRAALELHHTSGKRNLRLHNVIVFLRLPLQRKQQNALYCVQIVTERCMKMREGL